MLQIPYIGKIHNRFDQATNPGIMRQEESEIEVFAPYADGLFKTELSDYLEIYFHFDKSEPFKLKTFTYTGDYKGVFASRSPRRPSQIGNTIVKLISRKGNRLRVRGLDALNQSPLLDIKPIHIPLSEEEIDAAEIHSRKMNPRKVVLSNIWAGKTERLMLDAAQIHGHFCPGLAMGVMMATKAMQHIRATSDGLEDLLAIVETNNCISDGIQFVTGCTFGNNALIFKDYGKVAFTLTKRDGKGIRIAARPEAKAYMKNAHPLFSDSYQKVVADHDRSEEAVSEFKKRGIEKAFATLNLDFDRMFKTELINVEIPPYAPMHESLLCQGCGEGIMASRIVMDGKKQYCIPCAGLKGNILTGNGIAGGDRV
jgi:formylmethanofuran dehydrogenase subunit E